MITINNNIRIKSFILACPQRLDLRGNGNPLRCFLGKQMRRIFKDRQSFTNSYPWLTPPHSVPALEVLNERWIFKNFCPRRLSSRVFRFSVRLCILRLLRSVLPVKDVCHCLDAIKQKGEVRKQMTNLLKAFASTSPNLFRSSIFGFNCLPLSKKEYTLNFNLVK